MGNMESIPPQSKINGVSVNTDLEKGPYFLDGCDTLPKLFHQRCKELGERTSHREKDYGIWLSYSWNDFFEHSKLIAHGLISLGLERGEVVSILSEDNKEWVYCDLAIQCAGGIASGIYTTDSSSQLSYLVNDSDSRFLFVENDEQLDKYLTVRDQMPGLNKVIVFDREGLHDYHDDQVMFIEELYDLGRVHAKKHPELFEQEIAKSKPEDICILVYTSGTTGQPKGAMISHSNVMFSLSIGAYTLPAFETDEQVCFLPLCHILERFISVLSPIAARSTVNFAESPETVFDNVQEVSPHIFTAVPRVWEKIYSRISIMVGDATPFGRWAFKLATSAGQARATLIEDDEPVPALLELRYRILDALVLKNIRRMIGMDRLRRGTTGAAPISPDLLRWYKSIGIDVFEGYGMSETAGIISLNMYGKNKIGTVGQVVPGGKVRIGEGAEIQYKAGNVFEGYWKKPDKTRETMTDDGWLKTGDVGHIDNSGYVNITGRLKDIIITAGGKNITPAEIENKLKFSPYISDAVIIGDKRKFLSCLIMIDQENVEKFAQDRRVPFGDFASLCATAEVQELIGGVVSEVNDEFARVEQIKAFRLIDVLLTAEDDELTATMKLKRSFVEDKHKALIDEMYA
ncbi:AMP-dependent synthetase/ligase [Hoeflea poritis]|uniref:Long-chain fatty acid--CoA ligase n=1 Tax=Hoeflea poritis TaxID=2993659 RepID=A0ABT4VGI1_9HYPH|nr:long-chain fatty acid--CoA ligase [Hoeflea poritis]MDA4843811.1 long-chain fatty acid--CoA ligase [Hoeflea poritis]